MQIEKGKINGARFMFTIAFFLQSSSLLTSFISSISKQDSWIAVLIGFVSFIPIIVVYKTIMTDYPDKNLVQVLKLVFGKVLGTIISIFFVYFFLILTALNLSDLGNFAKLTVMFNTPKTILTLMCILVSVYAVRNGLSIVTRYSALFTFVEFLLIGLTLLMVLNLAKPDNFLPILNLEPMKYIQSAHIITTIPLGEIVVFLMLTPNVSVDRKKIFKYWFWGVCMGVAVLVLSLIRDVGVLGSSLHLFSLPGLITIRLVSLGPTFSRLEILFAIALFIILFFKVTFLLYITNLALAQTFHLKSFNHLVLIVGIFVVLYGLTLYPNPAIQAKSAQETAPVIWAVFEFLLPILVLVTGRIRGLHYKNKSPVKENQKQKKNQMGQNAVAIKKEKTKQKSEVKI